MLKALKSLAPSRPTSAGMEAELAAMRETEQALQARYDELALAAADGDVNQSEADTAHAALVKHRVAIARHIDTAAAVARREERDARAAERAAIGKAWETAQAQAKAREAIAARLQANLEQVAADYVALHAASVAVQNALPVGFPSHAAHSFAVEAGLAHDLVRVELGRRNLPGGLPLLGTQPQALADRYADATRCVAQARADWEAANRG
jgi:hypothetical protein